MLVQVLQSPWYQGLCLEVGQKIAPRQNIRLDFNTTPLGFQLKTT
jgi:hypothetical protein